MEKHITAGRHAAMSDLLLLVAVANECSDHFVFFDFSGHIGRVDVRCVPKEHDLPDTDRDRWGADFNDGAYLSDDDGFHEFISRSSSHIQSLSMLGEAQQNDLP